MAVDVRKEVLRLLKEDEEFRYAVAGYIGLSEVLKRLEAIENNLENLWTEVKGLREAQNNLWIEVKNLREEQSKLWVEVRELRVGQESLRAAQDRMWRYMTTGFRDLRRALAY